MRLIAGGRRSAAIADVSVGRTWTRTTSRMARAPISAPQRGGLCHSRPYPCLSRRRHWSLVKPAKRKL